MSPDVPAGVLGPLLEASPLGIVCIDSTGNVRVWSRAMEEMSGWPQHEVIGRRSPVELQLQLDGKPRELRLSRKDGGAINVEVRTAAWRDSEGD